MAPLEDNGLPQTIGIIFPPPEVRNIVDKTASFVARNGPEFEQRIKQNEVNNPKFNFLSPGDPYHAYYQHRVTAIRDGKDDEKKEEPRKAPAAPTIAPAPKEAVQQRQSSILQKAQKDAASRVEPPPPRVPPPEFEFVAEPPSISAFDLDVVKLTAQFVARNGRQFLTQLMQKEQRNYQFDFLRPQHSLFQYFTRLLEQYTKVLIPPKDLLQKLSLEEDSETEIMKQVDYRVRWLKHQEAKKRREEEEAERERVSYAQIDWHSFVVVETVDYQPWEVGSFPPPTNPAEVGARVLMQRRVETDPQAAAKARRDQEEGESLPAGESNMNVEDMEEDSSSSDDDDEEAVKAPPKAKPVDAAPAVNQPPLPTPSSGNLQVRKYDPKQKKGAAAAATPISTSGEQYLVSPITGEKIPASKMAEHMKVGLLDPRWVESRDKQITAKASEETVFAAGASIENSLKHLAERRTDIFGVGEDAAQEAGIGKKMGEDKLPGETITAAATTWDGHSGTAEAVTSRARANITLNDQIEQIHRAKGLLEDKEKIGPKLGSTVAQPPPAQPPIQQIRPAMVVAAAPPVAAPAPPIMAPPAQFFVAGIPAGMGGPMMGLEGEPMAKRPRGEEFLMPEGDFMANAPMNPVPFRVMCPVVQDKAELQLHGQVLDLTMNLQENVAGIKAKINEMTGLAPGKQKLQIDTIFLKDVNSLAYYNVRPGMIISLQIKERGGRKK